METISSLGNVFLNILSGSIRPLVSYGKEDGFLGGPLQAIDSLASKLQDH